MHEQFLTNFFCSFSHIWTKHSKDVVGHLYLIMVGSEDLGCGVRPLREIDHVSLYKFIVTCYVFYCKMK